MQINITGRHVEITDALRSYITEKFKRLERHFNSVGNIHIILSVEKDRQKAEASFHVKKKDIYAESENMDMYVSIDSLIDKIDRQIKKHKEKSTDHRGENAKEHRSENVEDHREQDQ